MRDKAGQLRRLTRAQFKARATAGDAFWLGALSFEARCTGSVRAIARAGGRLSRVALVDYPTQAVPGERDLRLRDQHHDEITTWWEAGLIETIERVDYDPYALHSLAPEFRVAATRPAGTCLFVDLTCLTKIHTIGLATALESMLRPGPVVLVYTTPENYTRATRGRRAPEIGWRDVLIVPLLPGAEVGTEAKARGVILVGHDPQRLGVALSEIEPVGGALIATHAPSRPDFRLISEERSRSVVRRLESARGGSWARQQVSLSDLADLNPTLDHEIASAAEGSAPLYLFPFGPKPSILAAAYRMVDFYPKRSWAVYPVPLSYDVNATSGIGSVMAYAVTH